MNSPEELLSRRERLRASLSKPTVVETPSPAEATLPTQIALVPDLQRYFRQLAVWCEAAASQNTTRELLLSLEELHALLNHEEI